MLRTDELKESAARAALDLVKDGMRLGLGTGSTAARFVAALGERVAQGLERGLRADLGGDARTRPSGSASRSPRSTRRRSSI